ncbi:MAG TPA: FecR domain-containing protein [Chryseosolibacter sp.]|nr:FecR domain-containing protein [Chryseosolibacter sp.]
MMDNARLEFLLDRYRSGSCTREEESELISILTTSDSPAVKEFLAELWNNPIGQLSTSKAETILNSILQKDDVVAIEPKKMTWLKVAAVISFLIVCGTGLYLYNNAPYYSTGAESVTQAADQHPFVKLPDGSKVILNNDSKLEYPESFSGKSTREVYLTGEAYFDIVHDPSRSFVVHTGKITTVVLGTAFNIRAYPGQDAITVTVTRGKVKVSNERQVLGILSPDDQITFHKNQQQAQLTTVNSKDVITWAEKDIYFDNVSMAEAAEQLSERFQVSITFENKNVEACRFTATFVKGEDLRQILDVICEFNDATYRVDKIGNVEISGNGCFQ